jgi:signal-transduction protein with cAMP-binding, CBS, and nucleotidyltransferase domain
MLAKRNEMVDYLGIILSGRALINRDEKTYSYLAMGDVIGYMGLLKVPGTQAHKFDIKGEKEGYIGIIRFEE